MMNNETTQPVLEEILSYYSSLPDAASQENLVAMLREIQEQLGCIPMDVQEDIADALAVKPILIRQLIKLFPSLTSAPRRHKITVCTGPCCNANHSDLLLDALRQSIHGKPFVLTTKNCLKQCRTAPNMKIDEDFYASVRPEDLPDILSRYPNQTKDCRDSSCKT